MESFRFWESFRFREVSDLGKFGILKKGSDSGEFQIWGSFRFEEVSDWRSFRFGEV